MIVEKTMRQLEETRCIVIGGGGFIGTNVCHFLKDKVNTLKAFGRQPCAPASLQGVPWISGDILDSKSVAEALADVDIVYHLVSSTTPSNNGQDTIRDLQSNVAGTLTLLEACRQRSVKRVVFVSSGGAIYGIPEQVPTPEDAPTNPISAYGVSKLSIEKYLALYEHLYGLEYRILRVANPYGPHQNIKKNQGVIATFIAQTLAGKTIEIWGDGSAVKDYIYIDDVVSALYAVSIHEGHSRTFNIGSGSGHSINEIIATIEGILGKKLDARFLDHKKTDVPLSILDIQLAMRELNWQPFVSLQEGISKTLAWIEG